MNSAFGCHFLILMLVKEGLILTVLQWLINDVETTKDIDIVRRFEGLNQLELAS